MSRSTSRAALAAACCLCALIARPALTASPDQIQPSDPSRLETIVVTAHRTPTREPVLPVITDDLDAAPAIGTDALRDLPSFAISQSGSLGSLTQVRVRGSEANHLLVLVDGLDVMDPTTDAGFNFANLNLSGISRLEFLPGAQSAIWGNQALAGVLQLSTEPATRIRRIETERGSFDTGYGSLQLADNGDRGYYNVSVADFSTDGTNIARAGTETDRYENTAWFGAGGVRGERWTLRGLHRQVSTRSDFDPTPFPTYLPADGDSLNTHEERLTAASFELRGAERPWTQRLSVSRFVTDNSTETDDVREAATDGERTLVSSITDVPIGARQQVIALLEYREERFEQWGLASFFGDPNQRQTLETQSVGLEYVLRPGEDWRLSASGRQDWNSDFEDSHSLRLAAHWAWRSDTTFWAAAGTGIKQPSFVERYGYTPDSFIGNPNLEAEENRHISFGVEHARGSGRHTLAVFRDRLENEINGFAFVPAVGGFTSVNEGGDSQRAGIEWASTWQWSSGLLRVGAYALNANDSDGTREIRRPGWHAFTNLQQSWRSIRVDAGLYRQDEQVDYDFAAWPARRADLAGYTLANAEVSVALSEGVRLGLRGNNLLDERWEDILGYRSPGRSWALRLRVDL
ncbi:MAG: TonB-dependent receptor plug domain-containing protein [Gammaproteobacteria bacterium]